MRPFTSRGNAAFYAELFCNMYFSNHMQQVRCTINGKQTTVDATKSLQQVLREMGLSPQRVVVEKNTEILHREDFASHYIADGDTLEILQFVGGGSGVGATFS